MSLITPQTSFGDVRNHYEKAFFEAVADLVRKRIWSDLPDGDVTVGRDYGGTFLKYEERRDESKLTASLDFQVSLLQSPQKDLLIFDFTSPKMRGVELNVNLDNLTPNHVVKALLSPNVGLAGMIEQAVQRTAHSRIESGYLRAVESRLKRIGFDDHHEFASWAVIHKTLWAALEDLGITPYNPLRSSDMPTDNHAKLRGDHDFIITRKPTRDTAGNDIPKTNGFLQIIWKEAPKGGINVKVRLTA